MPDWSLTMLTRLGRHMTGDPAFRMTRGEWADGLAFGLIVGVFWVWFLVLAPAAPH
jgi:hypothetical protein